MTAADALPSAPRNVHDSGEAQDIQEPIEGRGSAAVPPPAARDADDDVAPRRYIKLILFAALLGLASAVITFGFIALVHRAAQTIWLRAETSGLNVPLTTVAICSVGGLLVGLLVRIFGETSGVFAEIMQEFGQSGRFNYRAAPGVVLTSFVSLTAGGSLGPEMPMADACGGLGTWISDRLQFSERASRSMGFSGLSAMLAAFITSPFGGSLLGLESTRASVDYALYLFPGLIASATATTGYVLLSGHFFGPLYSFPTYELSVKDLLLAVPLGALGGLAGALFIVLFHAFRRLMEPLSNRVILRGLVGGVGMGVAGALLPLVLFSGEQETGTLISDASQLGVMTLVLLAVVKVAVTPLLITAGWKGGYIFPAMFAGAALGMAVHVAFPSVPAAAAVAATISGAMVAVMKAPIFSALFVMVLIEPSTAPVVAVAVVVGFLCTVRLSILIPPSFARARPAAIEAGTG